MTQWLVRGPLAATVVAMSLSSPAAAQVLRPSTRPVALAAAVSQPQVELYGTVLDDRGQPLSGAIVSALGATTTIAVSDVEGRCRFPNLSPGQYVVRAHLTGYTPMRGRVIQVNAAAHNVVAVTLSRSVNTETESPKVLAAGVGAPEVLDPPRSDSNHDHGEMAWRLRHLKRSVLKDVDFGLDGGQNDSNPSEGSLSGLAGVVAGPARLASSILADLSSLSGQINLLTVTSFDRPQDFFAANRLAPSGIAYVSLSTPAAGGEWAMRGVMTQGDLSSWILAGSFVRREGARHRYEAGLSYGMQRYQGGNADALAAMSDGSRNVGAVYAYDRWAINPNISVGYGAEFARYDYLGDAGLLSPSASVTVQPTGDDRLQIRGSVSRREVAPGAAEFLPPATGLWLPPERTFSPVGRRGFNVERVQHMEVAVERAVAADIQLVLRAFRQSVDDQIVTVFGTAPSGGTQASSLGHYYVASGGDVRAGGWGVGLARHFGPALNVSLDFARVGSRWESESPDGQALALLAPSAIRTAHDTVHDMTTSVESVVPMTDTRLFVTYKISTGFAAGPDASGYPDSRFDVQVKQQLPFMSFTNARWEMLVAVRNIFHDALVDASVYDELLVVRPPKRVIGGVTVKF